MLSMARAAAPLSIWRVFCGFWSGSSTVARLSTGGIDAMSGDTSARPGDLSPCDEGMRRMMASPLVTGVFWGRAGAGGGATCVEHALTLSRGPHRRRRGDVVSRRRHRRGHHQIKLKITEDAEARPSTAAAGSRRAAARAAVLVRLNRATPADSRR
jgi:hypothetical protein